MNRRIEHIDGILYEIITEYDNQSRLVEVDVVEHSTDLNIGFVQIDHNQEQVYGNVNHSYYNITELSELDIAALIVANLYCDY